MRWLSLPELYLSLDKYATIENPEILREHDKAIHIEYNHQRAWLSKSEIKIEYGDSLKITIPGWLFRKKFGFSFPIEKKATS